MSRFESYTEAAVRRLADRTSRRGFLGRLGRLLLGGGAATLPLLPIARGQEAHGSRGAHPGTSGIPPQAPVQVGETGDPTQCEYWRYCGIGGKLCACCGGSANACPPGSEMSPLGWIGTCRNPVDGRQYIISYNDCCGKPECSRCACGPENPQNRPIVKPQSSGEYVWCLGTKSASYTCGTANVLGVALGDH